MVYNILYSPAYLVPVLYFIPLPPVTPSATFTRGVVSGGDHLINGEMWWFVHPCLTGDAMAEWETAINPLDNDDNENDNNDNNDNNGSNGSNGSNDSNGNLGRYLGIWLGLVGAAAGLI